MYVNDFYTLSGSLFILFIASCLGLRQKVHRIDLYNFLVGSVYYEHSSPIVYNLYVEFIAVLQASLVIVVYKYFFLCNFL